MSVLRASLVALALLGALGACDLKKDNGNCTTQPGFTQGNSQVCTKDPPSQFDQMGK